MGVSIDGFPAISAEFSDESTVESQYLLGLQAKVHPDGSDAEVVLHTTVGSINLNVPFESMAAAQIEIRSASLLMLYRQSMKKDDGSGAIDDLICAALQPVDTSVVIQSNGDRIFILHFADRLPIVIRLTPEQVAESLENLSSETKRVAN